MQACIHTAAVMLQWKRGRGSNSHKRYQIAWDAGGATVSNLDCGTSADLAIPIAATSGLSTLLKWMPVGTMDIWRWLWQVGHIGFARLWIAPSRHLAPKRPGTQLYLSWALLRFLGSTHFLKSVGPSRYERQHSITSNTVHGFCW